MPAQRSDAAPEPFAEDQTVERADLLDPSGGRDEGVYEGDPADNDLRAEDRGEAFAGVDAVLQRHHHGPHPDERAGQFGGGLHVPKFGAEQHDVGGTDIAGPIPGPGGPHTDIARASPDGKAVPTYRLQMVAPRDEVHLPAACGKPRAEDPADAPRADDRNLHRSAAAAR